MPIKPVDFQVIIPKASEVSKINNAEQKKEHLLAQQLAGMTQQKAENSLRQVYTRDKINEAQIREKQKRSGEREEQGNKKRKSQKENKDITASKTNIIDIKI